MRAAQAGSREAFGRLVERFADPLHGFLCLRGASREDAEELTQESFLRAWRKLHTYRPDWHFSTWLFTVARRLAASHYRTVGRRPADVSLPDEPGVSAVPDPGEALAEREQDGRLWALAKRELNEEQLSALWLRYAEDFSIEDIAAVLERPSATVRVWLFRARERLGKLLEPPPGSAGTERVPPAFAHGSTAAALRSTGGSLP